MRNGSIRDIIWVYKDVTNLLFIKKMARFLIIKRTLENPQLLEKSPLGDSSVGKRNASNITLFHKDQRLELNFYSKCSILNYLHDHVYS